MEDIIKFDNIESKILELRDQKVLLDIDVAEAYHVETKRINEAVKNNPDKFPDGYILELTKDEWDGLKTKFSTSIKGGKVKLPNAFTERGLYMLATILKSPHATQTTLAIVETFTRFRELNRTIAQVATFTEDKHKQKTLMQQSGEILNELLGDDLHTTDTETTVEINFAVVKFKHTIKRK